MAEDTHVVRGIHWRDTFPFTNIFRTFRIAIHPSKLVLGLLALLSLYIGGRILDTLWPREHLAVPGEIKLYEEYAGLRGRAAPQNFANIRKAERDRIETAYARQLLEYQVESDPEAAERAAEGAERLGDLKDKIAAQRKTGFDSAASEREELLREIDAARDASDDDKEDARYEVWEAFKKTQYEVYENEIQQVKEANAIKGRGLFAEFFHYQVTQVDGVVAGVLAWNWLGGGAEAPGVVASIVNFFTVGPCWLLREHTIYFIVFAIWFLLVWSVFGGAISRIAAVHVARDEKISVRQALRFSVGKLLSFVFAPIIPLLIVLGVGVVVAVVALIGNIPYLGPIIIGGAFFLALIAGFIMALVLIGTAGGFNLMYPTIAVEGSDSFDAISRSFSYVYARPWRMLFYTLVALIYGALTYLFVRVFVWLMLVMTHSFVSLGMQINAPNGQDLWFVMWPRPVSPWQLSYDIPWPLLDWGGGLGAWLLAFWVYLAIGMIGAFAISFYFSANTIIYYLMRHEVDATELDDVFLEQSEEEISEAPAPASAPVAASAPTPSEPAAPAAPPVADAPPQADDTAPPPNQA